MTMMTTTEGLLNMVTVRKILMDVTLMNSVWTGIIAHCYNRIQQLSYYSWDSIHMKTRCINTPTIYGRNNNIHWKYWMISMTVMTTTDGLPIMVTALKIMSVELSPS
jgi:hypothetical protein